MLRGIVLLSFVLGTAVASRSANQYMDNVIQSALPQALRTMGLDPAPLSNFDVRFGPSGIYNNQGDAYFSSGNATGLNKVRRKGDCTGPRNFGGEITVNCTLSVYPILTAYKVIVRNGSNVYIVRNMGHVQETLVSVVIAGRPQNYLGSVKNFRIDRLGLITPTFSQLPPALNPYVKVLQDAYKSRVSTELFSILQQKYVSAIGRALSQTPMPRQ